MLSLSSIRCIQAERTLLSIHHFELAAGQFAAITGANGAGKSTLLKTIIGDRNFKGLITFHDKPIRHWSKSAKARHIAYLPQASHLSFAFTAYEVVALGLTPLSLGKNKAHTEIMRHMEECDCVHLANKSFPQLSGGEKQRVQLARVLLQLSQAEHSPLLLLDEPTSAQDLGQQHAILKLVQNLSKTKSFGILAILHDLNLVLRYCDHCLVLDQGLMVTEGRPEACLTPPVVERCWQYRPERVSASNGALLLV